MRRSASLLCCLTLLLVPACKSDKKADAAPTPSVTAPPYSPSPLPTCAPPRTKAYAWPGEVPKDLPRLPGVTIDSSKKTSDGLYVVQFTTAASLRDGVLFIVKRLPAAGYTLGRGDAEPTEADAPFTKGELRGVLRGAAVALCQTKWILAVSRQSFGGTGSPLLPPHQGASPSPLPFG
jgi:hypothetical protein